MHELATKDAATYATSQKYDSVKSYYKKGFVAGFDSGMATACYQEFHNMLYILRNGHHILEIQPYYGKSYSVTSKGSHTPSGTYIREDSIVETKDTTGITIHEIK
jgi:hypothetical protein